MKGGFLREMARMFFRAAYEKGRREGAGLVPRARLDEAMEMYGKLETEVAEWRKREAKVRAERDEAVAELEAAKARETLFSEERDESSLRKLIEREIGRFYDDEEAETLVGFVPDIIQVSSERAERIRVLQKDLEAARRERDEARARAEKIEAQHKSVSLVFGSESLTTEDACEIYKNFQASLMSKPAAYPWSDEAVERATRTQLEHRVFPGAWDMLKAETKEVFLARMRAALATLAPPPQAAPVPPVGVGDVWGDAVRVDKTDRCWNSLYVGTRLVEQYPDEWRADAIAERIREGLASLPPLRAVLVGGVTEGMVEAYGNAFDAEYRVGGLEHERVRRGRVAGLTAALAVSPIRVLGPGEGVVRVRVAKAGEECPSGSVYRLPTSHWYGSGAGGSVCETSEAWYILAADLDAAAAGLGKGGAHG